MWPFVPGLLLASRTCAVPGAFRPRTIVQPTAVFNVAQQNPRQRPFAVTVSSSIFSPELQTDQPQASPRAPEALDVRLTKALLDNPSSAVAGQCGKNVYIIQYAKYSETGIMSIIVQCTNLFIALSVQVICYIVYNVVQSLCETVGGIRQESNFLPWLMGRSDAVTRPRPCVASRRP